MAKKNRQPDVKHTPRITNRRARFNYHILEVVEAGIALVGTEVKSLRGGTASLEDAYVRIRGGQAFLVGLSIPAYKHASPLMQHEEKRDRKLLLHSRQIVRIEMHIRVKGNTAVPVSIYFKDGWAKCEIGLAVGKRQFDKRHAMKEKEQERAIAREMHRRSRE